jgi:hypothetical protein
MCAAVFKVIDCPAVPLSPKQRVWQANNPTAQHTVELVYRSLCTAPVSRPTRGVFRDQVTPLRNLTFC